jgi:uncharacterized membrane protein
MAALGLLGVAFALGYPIATARALEAFGTRPVALALVATGLLAFLPAVGRRPLPGVGPLPRSGLLALPVLAAASGNALFLRLVPAAIHALLASVFLGSLRGGGSLLQEAARRMHPHAPSWIGPYCRAATTAFAALFALQALALAGLALRPPAAGWERASTLLIWAPPVVASALEWIVRKTRFRYYGPGPVDRLLARLLPPERTARGRRSLDYIRRMRRELGMPPP